MSRSKHSRPPRVRLPWCCWICCGDGPEPKQAGRRMRERESQSVHVTADNFEQLGSCEILTQDNA